MADLKISQLEEVNSISSNDILTVVVDTGSGLINKKMKANNFLQTPTNKLTLTQQSSTPSSQTGKDVLYVDTNNTLKYVKPDDSVNEIPSFYNTTITSSSTPTPTGDRKKNELFITALSENATIQAPSGTAVDGNVLLIRIKDNGTARTLSFNSIYQGFAFSLPTSTTAGKTMYLGFVYNSSASKWQLLSSMEG